MTDKLHILERKLLYKELKPLFEELSSKRYAVVKGEVLSQQIYGAPDRRRSNDIDILVDKNSVKFLEEGLIKLGFKQQLPKNSAEARRNRVLCMAYSHQIPSYHKEKYGLHFNVDINYDIFWGEYEGQRCSIDEFLSDTVDMEIYGVALKALPITKAFVQLILHHYKEMNSLYHLCLHNTICTDMYKDVYDMLHYHRETLSIEQVEDLCENFPIGAYVYYMIYYTRQVFNDDFLNDYLKRMDCYRDADLVESYGLSTRERYKWQISFDERINNENLCKLVLNQITQIDLEKVNSNYKIFS